jgi:hypothetical protein
VTDNPDVPTSDLQPLIRLGRCKGCGTKRWLIAGPKGEPYEGLCQPCYAAKLKTDGVTSD